MKSTFLSLAFIFSYCILSASSASADTSKVDPWLGEFSGTLHIYNNKRAPSEIPMKVKHFRTDTAGVYGWYLIYGNDEATGTRAYYLKEVDQEAGHYVVDEKNTILLDTYLIGNKMISDFEVEGSTITSIYTLIDSETITFEIIAGKSDNPEQSGGEGEIPIVNSYQVAAYQHAELKRVIPEDK